MKKLSFVFMVLLLAASCRTQRNLESVSPSYYENIAAPVITGADRDEHGCIGSAGYVWSELKGDCIRPFEDGVRLMPVEKNVSTAAYVVFNADRSKAEIFLPSGVIILDKGASPQVWSNAKQDIVLSQTNQKLAITTDDKLTYKQN